MSDRARRLVWVDLETTGFDAGEPEILEIATLVTDDQLQIVACGPTLTIQSPLTIADAERMTLDFLREHTDERSAPLCGDTVWKDKQLLERWMPSVVSHLHYRLVDVATIKELARRWYGVPFHESARGAEIGARRGVERSISELAYYRSKVFIRA